MLLGQGIAMEGHNPMAARIPPAKLRGEFDEIEKSVRFVVDRMPSHADYLARYCPAAAA